MTLIGLLVLLLIVGIVMAFLPIDARIRQFIYVIIGILFVLWLLAAFGVIGDGFYVHDRGPVVHDRVIVR